MIQLNDITLTPETLKFTGRNIDSFIVATKYKLKIFCFDNERLEIEDLNGVKHSFNKGDVVDLDEFVYNVVVSSEDVSMAHSIFLSNDKSVKILNPKTK